MKEYIRPLPFRKNMKLLLFFTAILAARASVPLTADDFDEKTQGKKAFVKFYAPWCTHCKKLAPVWDALNIDALVGEVDCTVHAELCQTHGVKGYPTILYTKGYGWKKYEKGRDLEALEAFAQEHLTDGCFEDQSLCTADELQRIEGLRTLRADELDTRLKNAKAEADAAEALFQGHVKRLQADYETLTKEKEERLQELQEEQGFLQYTLNNLNTDL